MSSRPAPLQVQGLLQAVLTSGITFVRDPRIPQGARVYPRSGELLHRWKSAPHSFNRCNLLGSHLGSMPAQLISDGGTVDTHVAAPASPARPWDGGVRPTDVTADR